MSFYHFKWIEKDVRKFNGAFEAGAEIYEQQMFVDNQDRPILCNCQHRGTRLHDFNFPKNSK